jgi:glyoxylate utilization-related uncharacterized protein
MCFNRISFRALATLHFINQGDYLVRFEMINYDECEVYAVALPMCGMGASFPQLNLLGSGFPNYPPR